MALAVYRKAPSPLHTPEIAVAPPPAPEPIRPREVQSRRVRQLPLIPLAFMILGALLIGSVAGPIASYFLFTGPELRANAPLVSPLSPEADAFALQYRAPIGQPIALAAPQVYRSLDYRKPSTWFPNADFPASNNPKQYYSLSIPKLGIERAVVEIGGEDLSTSLIHYPGTSLPGELGAPVIFGHSILRIFYNPKSYLSIFSTIMTLKPGDPILVFYDGVTYTYRVIERFEVKPSDIQILQQKYNGRYIKLVTCVPEGTYLRRGIIVGQLET